jgi:hypothetical protein
MTHMKASLRASHSTLGDSAIVSVHKMDGSRERFLTNIGTIEDNPSNEGIDIIHKVHFRRPDGLLLHFLRVTEG